MCPPSSGARKPASTRQNEWPCGIAVWLKFAGVVAVVGHVVTCGCGTRGGLSLQHGRMRLRLPQGAFAASNRATHLGWFFLFAQPRAVLPAALTSSRAPALMRMSKHLSWPKYADKKRAVIPCCWGDRGKGMSAGPCHIRPPPRSWVGRERGGVVVGSRTLVCRSLFAPASRSISTTAA